MSTDLRPWVDNMTLTGRRQVTSVAASRLRQWVNGTHEGRPTRGELKAWVLLVLDERRDLHNRVEALTKERDVARHEVEALRGDVKASDNELDAVTAQRDEALEGYREDVERFRAHVETLDADRTRRTRERDGALEVHARLNETITHLVKAYEEMRTAWELAEAELREERKGRGVGRASCSHASRGGAE